MRALLRLCLTLSGGAALALEMLWMRSAQLAMGASAETTASVLALYFVGLGLGAAWARSPAPSPVRRYGLLELGAAAGALWSLALLELLRSDAAQRWLASAGEAGALASLAVAVLPATICLGATLPALAPALVDTAAAGSRGAVLYALNTAGGSIGIAAAGFGLPALIGVQASYLLVASTSALAGVLALAAPRGAMPAAARADGKAVGLRTSGGALGSRARLRAAAAGAGALGLGLEVLWTRLLAQVLHNSVYSFAAVSLVIVLSLALGAAIAGLALRRLPADSLAAGALLGAAAATAGGFWLFVYLTDGLGYFGMTSGLFEYLLRIVALTGAVAGSAAVASGIVLPALWAAWGGAESASRPLGDLLAANTFGGIAGTLVAGFVAIPGLGLRAAFLAAAVLYVLLADLVTRRHGALRLIGYATLLAIIVADPMRAPIVRLRAQHETLLASYEGPSGIVTVVDSDGDVQLRLDNTYVLGGSAAATNQRRQGLVPLLLHPDPQRVAFIGLATGATASAGPALGVASTTAVELVPEVALAAREHFSSWNGGLFGRGDVHVVVDDGRRFLAASRDSYDVIVADLFIPWHMGAGSLYAREFFASARRRLAPGGLFCQWLPLYQLTREEFDIVARTFLAVFPDASLWRDDFYPDRPVVALVGRPEPAVIDLVQVADRLAALPDWARDPLLVAPRGLAMLYAGELAPAAGLFAAAPINDDDRPVFEFLTPRLTRIGPSGDKDWFTGETLAEFYDELDRLGQGDPASSLPETVPVRAARRAGRALYGYALATAAHDPTRAARLEAEVRELVPEVIASADAADPSRAAIAAPESRSSRRDEQQLARRRLEAME